MLTYSDVTSRQPVSGGVSRRHGGGVLSNYVEVVGIFDIGSESLDRCLDMVVKMGGDCFGRGDWKRRICKGCQICGIWRVERA